MTTVAVIPLFPKMETIFVFRKCRAPLCWYLNKAKHKPLLNSLENVRFCKRNCEPKRDLHIKPRLQFFGRLKVTNLPPHAAVGQLCMRPVTQDSSLVKITMKNSTSVVFFGLPLHIWHAGKTNPPAFYLQTSSNQFICSSVAWLSVCNISRNF